MKTYKQFAEEANQIDEGVGAAVKGALKLLGRGGKAGLKGAGAVGRGALGLGGHALSGAGHLAKGTLGLAGNILKGALSTADKASKQTMDNNRTSKGQEQGGLDKIT